MQALYEKLVPIVYSQVKMEYQSQNHQIQKNHRSWIMTFGVIARPRSFEEALDELYTEQGTIE